MTLKNDDDQKQTHECVYVGPHKETSLEPLDKSPAAPSEEIVRTVSLSVLCRGHGCIKPLPHFKLRMKVRNFDIFDVIYVIRNGTCAKVQYCADYQDHKFTFRGLVDGVGFDATFALSARHDLIKAPLMFLITGCWKTDNGERSFRY